ncbi:MAG: TldD/PmbA family protein [Candidatus Thorarchaeota archaeon]
MEDVERLKEYVDVAVDYAEDKTEGILARGTVSTGSQIRFSQNAIDISKRWEELKLDLFLIVDGGKTGFTDRSVTGEAEVKEAIDNAISFIKRLPESKFFAGVEDTPQQYTELSGCYDPHIDEFTEEAPQYVNAAIDAALAKGAKRVAGALKFSKESIFLRSSFGPEANDKRTQYDFNIRAFQDELDYSGQGLACGTLPSEAEEDFVNAGEKAGRLSKMAEGAEQGEPGTYDLILSPTVAANLMGYIPASANPFFVLIGMSPLGDKMGEQIAPETVSIRDAPHVEGGVASKAFDMEGTATQQTPLIEDGVLKKFIHNTSTARMYETESTGNSDAVSMGRGTKMLLPAPTNIVFDNGDHTFEELVEDNDPAIYVTSNWYTRFQNYQSSEFSSIPRDAMFLIKNGAMKPIKNLRISDNLLRMFSNISALGNDRRQVYWWEVDTPTFIPSMRIEDCKLSAATK